MKHNKIGVAVLCLAVISTPILAQTPRYSERQILSNYKKQVTTEDYFLGKARGKIDGSQGVDCLWMGVGGLFGCLGVGAAFVFPPNEPPSYATLGKSTAYQMGYRDGFIEGKREMMVKSALIGWGVWVAAVLAVMLVGGESGY